MQIKTCSFFGHRNIFNLDIVRKDLLKIVEELIINGFNNFMIGTHGDFDSLALSICRELRKKYDIKISIVFTSVSKIIKNNNLEYSNIEFYEDCETLFFDIEEIYFKNRITYSNYKMIDKSDTIVCYVNINSHSSGAKKAMNYAIKNNKEIINIFKQTSQFF